MHPATVRQVKEALQALDVPIDVGAVYPASDAHKAYGIWQHRPLLVPDVLSLLPRLARENAHGAAIYMRPWLPPGSRDNDAHCGIVLVDDLAPAAVDAMRNHGIQPLLVVETSPKNYQSWVKIGGDVSVALARLVARLLAERYGGDPKAVAGSQPGRLPGFVNRKPHHRRDDGSYPFCRLVSVNFDATIGVSAPVIDVARRCLESTSTQPAARAAHAPETPHKAAHMPASVEDDVGADLTLIWFGEQARIEREIASGRRPTSAGSFSEVDFGTAVAALRFGVDESQIAGWLQRTRPEKSANYGARTVSAATEYLRRNSDDARLGRPEISL